MDSASSYRFHQCATFLPVLLDKHHDGERQNHLRDMVNSQKKTAEKIMMTQIRSQPTIELLLHLTSLAFCQIPLGAVPAGST